MKADDQVDFEALLERCAQAPVNRTALWTSLANATGVRSMAEIGVYRGEFAAAMLSGCPGIQRYYMVDPWKHQSRWNKPANVPDADFDGCYRETLSVTEFAAEKRKVLRGTTTEVIESIPDETLDLAYVDGDHTLRGITIDLVRVYPKVRNGGLIGGDDFCPSIWQHPSSFEPTLVFPLAVYFAEAVGARIFALPADQFVIQKSNSGFAFLDLTGKYGETEIRRQMITRGSRWRQMLPRLRRRFLG